MNRAVKALLPILLVAAVSQPGHLFACAACYGKSDSPMAQGMNWGIFSLLVVVVGVLGSIGGFFIYLARKSAAVSAAAAAKQTPALSSSLSQ